MALDLKEINISHLIDKNDWFDHSETMLRFQLSNKSIDFLKREFGYESNRKPIHRHYEQHYVKECDNQFLLNQYFKYHVFGELHPIKYKACVMDTPKYNNLVIISKR